MKKPLSNKLDKISPSMTLAITSKANKIKREGTKVYSFGTGEPDFDTPSLIIEAANEAMKKGITRYTDVKGLIDLRQAISDKYKKEFDLSYDPETEIIVSSGAKHSLFTTLQALISDGDEVIIPVPYWVSYSEMVKVAGGEPIFVYPKKENNFILTKEELKSVITPKSKVIMLNNPSNPTGVVYTKEQLKEIAEVCLEEGIYILSDEIYEMLLYNNREFTPVASLSEEIKDITITINGASKSYAMTGWRVGYALANKDIIKAMNTIQGQCVSHPSSISQYATVAALKADQSIVSDMVKEYDKRRKYMLEELKGIEGVNPIEPDGAFYVFADVSAFYGKEYNGKTINGSIEFADALLSSKYVAVIPGIGFGADDFIRFSYATGMDDIKKGLKLFKEFINEIK
ncbi:pyridoxal phosphate-dependent aminotransferase [Anaerofustis stercorihominis]|uniref:Aminotransferase n=1 Tax=Anaerofustis stercorihominis DSM 17244 TaxID=445971 RepID=B1C6N0_9FIRM|nr:pyridoxal phosphate-dependent aminotransferase [Anaerofustis stercorihominis]EDS72667.1 aminotransferase, class I/II [Anaerofustis stercorihominis DSM 17244]MCQ4794043.1 pyridoxal phosphate-dependent aminotransferase [Anaerofustis stercorihominis]